MTRPLEVLILDDEREAADMLAELLAMYFPDARFQVANTGEEALRLSAARQPSVAIMDLEMPGLGGEEAAYALRAAFTGSAVQLIALSGNVLRLAALRDAGPFDHLLSKPVDVQALVELLGRSDHHVRTY